MVNDKTSRGDVKEGLDRLEDLEVAELSDDDLESVAGGVDERLDAGDCNSSWCCSNNNG